MKTYVETGGRPKRFVKVIFIGSVLETRVNQPKTSREAPALGRGKWLGTGGPPPGSQPGGTIQPRKMQTP